MNEVRQRKMFFMFRGESKTRRMNEKQEGKQWKAGQKEEEEKGRARGELR